MKLGKQHALGIVPAKYFAARFRIFNKEMERRLKCSLILKALVTAPLQAGNTPFEFKMQEYHRERFGGQSGSADQLVQAAGVIHHERQDFHVFVCCACFGRSGIKQNRWRHVPAKFLKNVLSGFHQLGAFLDQAVTAA